MKLSRIKTNYDDFVSFALIGMLKKSHEDFFIKDLRKFDYFTRVSETDFSINNAKKDPNINSIERLVAVNPWQVVVASQGDRMVGYLIDCNQTAIEIANCRNPFGVKHFENIDINRLDRSFVKVITSAATNFDGSLLPKDLNEEICDLRLYVLGENDKKVYLTLHEVPWCTAFYQLKIVAGEVKKIRIPRQNIITLGGNSFIQTNTDEVIYACNSLSTDCSVNTYILFKNGKEIARSGYDFSNEELAENLHNEPIKQINLAYNDVFIDMPQDDEVEIDEDDGDNNVMVFGF